MPDLKIGDVVRLNSGGPKMTIQGPGTTAGSWYCVWMDGAKKCADQFHPDMLCKADYAADDE